MFKFIRQYAEQINGGTIYPMISLVIFVLFFAGVLWYVKGMKKSQVDELKNIPFDQDGETVNINS
jgi:cytochrome c oxidase cbb3-type subunit IV